MLQNTNTLTHIDFSRNFKSNLDLIFSSTNISDLIDVKVHDETWGSDHYPTFININVAKNLYTKKTFKIKCVRTDCDRFATQLDSLYCSFFSIEYESLSPVKNITSLSSN